MPHTPGISRKSRFGQYEVDFRAGELLKNGRKIRLQDQPLQVLAMLLESPGDAVTREELRQKLWPGDTFVDFDHGLNNAINRLREALNDSADDPRFIETLPRRGYRFIADVNNETAREIVAEANAGTVDVRVTAEPSSPTTQETNQTEEAPPAQRIHHRIKPWLVMAAAAACVVTLVVIFLDYKHSLGRSAALQIQSVAVLPLENFSGDPSQDYFADGMTDALTTSLAQLRGIRVVSRTSSVHYKDTKQKLPEIAKELGVDAVVEGSTSRSNGVVHVNAQLIYAPGDRHIWARAYEGPSSNLSRMENEIANDIALRLGTGAGLASETYSSKTLAVNPEAYDLYLRAASYYGLERREANDQAVQLLEKSVELDPQFAAAFASLGTAYRVRAFSVEINEPKWIEKANAAVAKSLSLDPNLAEGYVSRGYLLWSRANDWAVERAVADYKHALELNPNLAEARHQLANVYNHVGLLDKADAEIKKAVALDPLNTGIRYRVGINLLYQGKYEEALAEMRDSEKFLPGLWAFQTSFALQHLGRRQEAEERISMMLKSMPTDPGGSLTSIRALLAADAGDGPLAQHQVQEAIAKGNGYQHFHHVAYAVASAYALLGKREEALQYLRIAADDGFPCYPLFEHDTNLDRLRNDPPFQAFLTEQKKQWEYFSKHL
jgi:TolB-like protein/DNA-binding winged helix-turn-helix (wHTH) protein/tetratricopeptide (TPR) repeat protein